MAPSIRRKKAAMSDAPLARLLIVDDEAAHLRALCDTLGDSGYVVQGCAGAQEALAALAAPATHRFDLLLTDLHMPGMNGIELMRAALAADPALVGIIMTGAGSISTAVQALQSGALDYILKPFKLNTALPVLARALQVRSLRQRNLQLEAQLRGKVEELAAANSDLESFSFSVSHDLRAPLQVVAGFSSILVRQHAGQLDEKGLHYL